MKRIGKFYVSKEYFAVPPQPLIDLLHELTVLSLKHVYGPQVGVERYEIVAEFDEFDEVPDGEIPEYTFTFKNLEDGGVERLPAEKLKTYETPIFDYGAFDR